MRIVRFVSKHYIDLNTALARRGLDGDQGHSRLIHATLTEPMVQSRCVSRPCTIKTFMEVSRAKY